MAKPAPARLMPRLLAGLLLASAPVPAMASGSGEPAVPEAGPDFEMAIFELRLRARRMLLPDMMALTDARGRVYLPLDDLAQALEFHFADEGDGRVSGWFLRQDQGFELDPQAGTVTLAGRAIPLRQGDLVMSDGALMVALDSFDGWFQLGAQVDAGALVIDLAPRFLLSSEEAAMRTRLRVATGDDRSDLVPLAPTYDLAAWRHASVNMVAARVPQGDGAYLSGSLFTQADLLWLDTSLVLTGDTRGLAAARLSMGRTDAGNSLLGPLRASTFVAGDIVATDETLVHGPASGMGLRIAREPLELGTRFDATRIVFEAPPGWQAELYRDGQLLGFGLVGADGQYAFEDVPMTFGRNRFVIELHGPAGERDTIRRTIDIASSLTRAGELRYSLLAMRQGHSLLSAPSMTSIERQSDLAEARVAYGLAERISVSAFTGWTRYAGTRAQVLTTGIGAVAGLGPLLAGFDGAVQDNGAQAWRASMVGGLGATAFSFSHRRASQGFLSDASGGQDMPATRATAAGIDGRIGGLAAGLSASETQNDAGSRQRRVLGRASVVGGPVSLTQGLGWQEVTQGPGAAAVSRAFGTSRIAGSIGPLRMHLGLEYELDPRPRVQRLDAEAGYRLGYWYLAADATGDFTHDSWQLGMSANRDWNGIRLGTQLLYDANLRDVRGLLTLSFALSRRAGGGGGIAIGRDAGSMQGELRAHGFRDANANGVQDEGEEDLAGFEVTVDPRGSRRSGVAGLVEALPVRREISVRPDMAGVDDPYLVPADDGYLVTVRAGATTRVAVPLVESGEIVATLRDASGAPLAGRQLTLGPCDTGQALKAGVTAFDGKAFFEQLRPGCYVLAAGAARSTVQVVAGDAVTVSIEDAGDAAD